MFCRFTARFAAACEHGTGFACLKTAAYRVAEEAAPAVGDFVLLEWREDGESRILKAHRTYFLRLDPLSSGHDEHAVAANCPGRGGKAIKNFAPRHAIQMTGRTYLKEKQKRFKTIAKAQGGRSKQDAECKPEIY